MTDDLKGWPGRFMEAWKHVPSEEELLRLRPLREWEEKGRDIYAALERVENAFPNPIETHEYYSLECDKSCLDGTFSATELRAIADAMDALKDTPEYRAYAAHKALKPER